MFQKMGTSASVVNCFNGIIKWVDIGVNNLDLLYPRFEKVGGILVDICPSFRPSVIP